jgi:hypothetical protein
MMALAAAGAVAFAGTARATDIGVTGIKLIIIDKGASSKAVAVSKDPLINKGAGTNIATVSGSMQVKFDATAGEWEMNAGANWLTNNAAIAKYINAAAPSGGSVKVGKVKPATLFKVVAKSTGDTPIDISAPPSGSLYVALNVTNAGDTYQHCSEYTLGTCSHKVISGGFKLVCKGAIADSACNAATPPPTGTILSFVTGPAGGSCGASRTGGSAGTVLKSLTCGGLNIGGGASIVAEGPTPANAETQFNTACVSGACTVTARTAAETGSINNCSDTSCVFGPYLPIASGGTSTCVQNTFGSPAAGALNSSSGTFTGSIPLSSLVTLTGNAALPCPPCMVAGVPGMGAGTCNAAASNPGAACTGINTSGNTYDCIPSGFVFAPFPVILSPISTGTTSDTGPTFCPGQDATAPGLNGCFGGPTCDYISETGTAAGTLTAGTHAVTIGSVFCIPAVGNPVVDGAADLPGPGATSLPGTFELLP